MPSENQHKKNKKLADEIPAWPHEHFNDPQRSWMGGEQIAQSLVDQEKEKIDLSESQWKISNQLKNILVINVVHDTELSKKQRTVLPTEIDRYITPAWNTSRRYYILKYGNGASRTFVGYAWGSEWRETDAVMKEFLKKIENDPKLKSILCKKMVSLKELYKEII